MNIRKIFFLLIPLSMFLLTSCKTAKEKNTADNTPDTNHDTNTMVMATPPVIIYKTYKDYHKNVPVTLSADKSAIVSYPDIKDVYYNDTLAYPTRLARGFWLDNRGIGPHAAFLKFTYEEYSQLEATPAPDVLFQNILETDPFKEIYKLSCERDTVEINKIIKSGLSENCKKIK
ncbi:MAG TPA: hypothetical protein PLC90_04960 [Bacteroidales bacterium]|nr:hypothetical protein [Bacteroidales bacterium]